MSVNSKTNASVTVAMHDPMTQSLDHMKESAPAVRVIKRPEEMEEIRATWTAWCKHRDADFDVYRLFLESIWQGAQPYIVVIERDRKPDAILVGKMNVTSISGNIGYIRMSVSGARVVEFVYQGFLGNQSQENSELIVNELARALRRGEMDVAVLSYVPENSTIRELALNINSSLMKDFFPNSLAHWVLEVPETKEPVYAAISRGHRSSHKEESRKFRKFRTDFPDLKMVQFQGTASLETLLKDAEQVAATTYQRGLGVGFSDSPSIRALLTLEATKGWLRGHVLYAGGRPCAFQMGCRYGDVFLGEYLGHDPTFAKYAPGSYLIVQIIEALERENVAAFDWGIGDAPYKRRFGTRSWEESTIRLFAPTIKGIKSKTLLAMTEVVSLVGKRILSGTQLEAKIKKIWRNRLASGGAGVRNDK
jgi:CelD/BcsL family acetyltransferase involved in cellulose biosynthesis